jgi:hypothetical protein
MCTTPPGRWAAGAVEREVVDRAQRQAVHHRRDAFRLGVRNDVRHLDEGTLA